jgi:hypothetical protein
MRSKRGSRGRFSSLYGTTTLRLAPDFPYPPGGARYERADRAFPGCSICQRSAPGSPLGPSFKHSIDLLERAARLDRRLASTRRQFMVKLRGTTELIASDGERRELGPGAVLLIDDTVGRGHYSRILGPDDDQWFVAALATAEPNESG